MLPGLEHDSPQFVSKALSLAQVLRNLFRWQLP